MGIHKHILEWIESHNGEVLSTGGGCEAICVSFEDNSYIHITNDAQIPTHINEDICVSFYNNDDSIGSPCFSFNVKGGLANFDVNFMYNSTKGEV